MIHSQQQRQTFARVAMRMVLGSLACCTAIARSAAIAKARPLSPELAAPLPASTTGNSYSHSPEPSALETGPADAAQSIDDTQNVETTAVATYTRSVPQPVTVRVFVDGVERGTLSVLVRTGSPVQLQFRGRQLLDLVGSSLPVDVSTRLSQAAQVSEDMLTANDVQQVGVEVAFSQEFLELHLHTAEAVPAGSEIAIADGSLAARLDTVDRLQASESASVESPEGNPNWVSLNANLRFAEGWVLATGGSLQEGPAEFAWQRDRVRAVYSNGEDSATYTVGEFSVDSTGYQSSMGLVGVQATSRATSVPSQSQIEVSADGIPTQALAAPEAIADPAELQVFTDESVESSESDVSEVSEDWVAPAREYSYAIGVLPPAPEWEEPTELEDRLVVSLSNRWHAGRALSAETYLQGTASQQVVGVGASWSTVAGDLNWDVAASQPAEVESGVATEVQLRSNLPVIGSSLELGAAYRDAEFLEVGETFPLEEAGWTLSAAFGQQWFDRLHTELSGRYRLRGDRSPEELRLGLGVSTAFTERLGLTLDLAQTEEFGGVASREAFIQLYLY